MSVPYYDGSSNWQQLVDQQQPLVPTLQNGLPQNVLDQQPLPDDWAKHPPAHQHTATHRQQIDPQSDFASFASFYPHPPNISNLSNFTPFFNHHHHVYDQSPQSWQLSSLPLSSFSTLDGATTTSPAQQQQPSQNGMTQSQLQNVPPQAVQPQHVHQPPPQHMQHSHSASHQPPPHHHHQSLGQPQQQQPQHQLQHQVPQSLQHHTSMVIDPVLVMQPPPQHVPYGAHVHQQPQPYRSPMHAPPIQMSTINPSILQHHPSTSMQGQHGSPATMHQFAQSPIQQTTPAPPQPPVEPSGLERIRGVLTPRRIEKSPDQTVDALLRIITGTPDTDRDMRIEVLTKLRDHASKEFFELWARDTKAMAIFREWLKAGALGKTGSWVDTLMPLLQVIDRLPLTFETLKAAKLGKPLLKLSQEPPSTAIKDLAGNIEAKWRKLQPSSYPGDGTLKAQDEASASKKRKLSDPPTKPQLPVKKVAVASVTSAKPQPVKKEPKVVVTTTVVAGNAKSDSSFFSSKPKPKLPSFRKTATPTAPVKKEDTPDPTVAQPSSFDPFQDALKAMGKGRVSAPTTSTDTNMATDDGKSPSKKRKSVRFAPDGELEKIKFIEKAIYDDDNEEGGHRHSMRDLDREEGAAMHQLIFEELIDWYEPSIVEIPEDLNVPVRGSESQEAAIQEEREKSALGALYMVGQIPDSPSEPTTILADDLVDAEAKTMVLGSEVEALVPTTSSGPSVHDLVAQLAAGHGPTQAYAAGSAVDGNQMAWESTPFDIASLTSQLQTIGPDQLQQIRMHFQQQQQQQQPQALPYATPPGYGQDSAGWNQNDPGNWNSGLPQPLGMPSYEEDRKKWGKGSDPSWGGGGRGRGGRGGFRNGRRKPCSFFQSGRQAFETLNRVKAAF